MLQTTIGQLLINRALPPDMQDYNRLLDRKGTRELFKQIAELHPDKYRTIAHRISNIGHEAATSTGGYSFGLKSLRTPLVTKLAVRKLEEEIKQVHADPDLSEDAREEKIVELVTASRKALQPLLLEDARATGNPLSGQIVSGARGNAINLNSILGYDGTYVDHRDRAIGLPVLRNYSQGLRPAEYFAGAFGARRGLIDLKAGTASAGYFAKQLSQVSHRLVVSGDDDDTPEEEGAAPRGLPVSTDDPENEGSLLAVPVAGYPRNTQLTSKLLRTLKAAGHDEILVRSPMVGGPADGGVYARDAGIREKGRLAPQGDYVGLAAAQALGEPITQSTISSKHSGGVAGASAGAIGGFKYLDALIQAPKIFPSGAAHAQKDGLVAGVREAPQGGWFVSVDGDDHYVGPESAVTVKPGDAVEAGDVLSEGIPNPAEIVRHKGVGEGRRYFAQAFHRTMKNSGIDAHRRNIELLGRGLINHVRLTDELGDWSPDDVVPYQTLERQWQTRPGTQTGAPRAFRNRFIEKPVLHYTIGTRITPSVVSTLEKHGVKAVQAHAEAPPFQSEMIRGMANVAQDPDWMTRMLGSYQKDSLLEGTRRGATSDTTGTSYVPALAEGSNFGRIGLSKGWKP